MPPSRRPLLTILLLLLVAMLAACQAEVIEVTRIVTQTEEVVVTQVVEVEGETVVQEVVVTATPEPLPTTTSDLVVITRIVTITPGGPTAAATRPPVATSAPQATPTLPPQITATSEPLATANAPAATIAPTATPLAVSHEVEVEWPPRLRTGESGLVRLALYPTDLGFVAAAEMPDGEIMTEQVVVEPQPGYDLEGAAALQGVAFTIGPSREQRQPLDPHDRAEWRWTVQTESPGDQTLNLTLTLHWVPQPGNDAPARQKQLFGQSFRVRVRSWLGLTLSQAMLWGFVGLAVASGLSWPLLGGWLRPPFTSRVTRPNPGVSLEPHPAIPLNEAEQSLLQAQFRAYRRVLIEAEFRSGYSGARTLLALPIHADNRHDAATIIKMGAKPAIEQEFANYETFVRNTLPPMTARILARPLTTRRSRSPIPLAALRYTFIGEPGQKPTSLRQQLLQDPDPLWLEKLFRTFGTNWWRQHQPYRYRIAAEFDRKLPAHLVLQPMSTQRGRVSGRLLDGREPYQPGQWQVGDLVECRAFRVAEHRTEGSTPGGYMALLGQAADGQIATRVRWLGERYREGLVGRVVATRESLLAKELGSSEQLAVSSEQLPVTSHQSPVSGEPSQFIIHNSQFIIPSPFQSLNRSISQSLLPTLLNETIQGTRSIIHGDLNLENVLVGPEGVVWLIDFAETRLGPPVYDFAHLGAELIAHVIAPQEPDAAAFHTQFRMNGYPLLDRLEKLAQQCLFDRDDGREYHLALALSCLGALKYSNLDRHQKELLAVAAASLTDRVTR